MATIKSFNSGNTVIKAALVNDDKYVSFMYFIKGKSGRLYYTDTQTIETVKCFNQLQDWCKEHGYGTSTCIVEGLESILLEDE